MESFAILINKQDEYQKVLDGSLPDLGDAVIITKDGATVEGQPAVMIAFTVRMPDGSFKVVQTVTTLKLFLTVADTLKATYNWLGY